MTNDITNLTPRADVLGKTTIISIFYQTLCWRAHLWIGRDPMRTFRSAWPRCPKSWLQNSKEARQTFCLWFHGGTPAAAQKKADFLEADGFIMPVEVRPDGRPFVVKTSTTTPTPPTMPRHSRSRPNARRKQWTNPGPADRWRIMQRYRGPSLWRTYWNSGPKWTRLVAK